MKLSEFITVHTEEILQDWDSFAATLSPAADAMSVMALRDHARQILRAIALDMETGQTAQQQDEKSKGLAPQAAQAQSAASIHGTQREASGFTLLQLTAEYRALRASVLRLWLARLTEYTPQSTNDILRFNEGIDQALAESAVTYAAHAKRTGDTFLAILGHDLRGPLAAMSMAGTYLSNSATVTGPAAKTGLQVKRGAATMTAMVNDLLEYARTQLGSGMPVTRAPAGLGEICRAAMHDAAAMYPDCRFALHESGDLHASLDSVRMQQALTNLLINAAQYGAKDFPVALNARGQAETVRVGVNNQGTTIPAASLEAIFSPLVQLESGTEDERRPSGSLGLGLFVAREIALAHGGTLDVQSTSEAGTTFTIELPRNQARLPGRSQ